METEASLAPSKRPTICPCPQPAALGPIQIHTKWSSECLSPGIKRPDLETENPTSTPTSIFSRRAQGHLYLNICPFTSSCILQADLLIRLTKKQTGKFWCLCINTEDKSQSFCRNICYVNLALVFCVCKAKRTQVDLQLVSWTHETSLLHVILFAYA